MVPPRRRKSATPDASRTLARLFTGKKAKWLPLYQRLAARFTRYCAIDLSPLKTTVSMGSPGNIRITPDGLELRLSLPKGGVRSSRLTVKEGRATARTIRRRITHQVMIAKIADIDEELLSWVKAALVQTKPVRR